jgi:hypothetical protein
MTALNKCSTQAANAIDAWSRKLIEQAIEFDGEIASMLGEFLHYLLCGKHTPYFRAVINLSRGVALPKPDGSGVRPLCVSSIFLKMLGLIASERDNRKPSEAQYAIGPKDGAKRVVHKVRDFVLRNRQHGAVCRFDISNAYEPHPDLPSKMSYCKQIRQCNSTSC